MEKLRAAAAGMEARVETAAPVAPVAERRGKATEPATAPESEACLEVHLTNSAQAMVSVATVAPRKSHISRLLVICDHLYGGIVGSG